jgi:hypothetical protein
VELNTTRPQPVTETPPIPVHKVVKASALAAAFVAANCCGIQIILALCKGNIGPHGSCQSLG